MPVAIEELTIWQWNCASFKQRRTTLQQYIAAQTRKPQVILLQETLCDAPILPGFRTVASHTQNQRGTATLVARHCSFQEHKLNLGNSRIEAVMVEIIPNSQIREQLFILNVYSAPSDYHQSFKALISKASALAKNKPLIIAGDFNAPHAAWGYPRHKSHKKGDSLLQATTDCSLQLLTDPQYPTRIGTSVARDTTPDLAFAKNITGETWANLQENLGSDHYITSVTVPIKTRPKRTFQITDWDAFRQLRSGDHTTYEDTASLFVRLKEDVQAASRSVETCLEINRMDARLAHLLEAKESILARWKTQRLNRRLRRKVAELNREITRHSEELARQRWTEVCALMDGRMRVGGRWDLLKHLLDDSENKGNQRLAIDRIIHKQKMAGIDDAALLRDLANRYLPMGPADDADYPDYQGTDITELDSPFTVQEIWAVLQELNGGSAPGPDGISNKLLRNLDSASVELLTKEANRVWNTGEVPDDWKLASVILIPKPGKPLAPENLRPISLTSCVGKVIEHVIHNRISQYIESNDMFPYNMLGFRQGLSTQDAMLMIKHQIIDRHTKDVGAILALDLTKAFDTVSHKYLLQAISQMNLGKHFYNYVRSFLRNRKATLKIGHIKSTEYTLGAQGTPQGAVISPLLFNIAMKKLSEQLAEIPGIHHALYADDITVWSRGGSDADIEQRLQRALEVTESFLVGTGLNLSPSKSELLLYRSSRKGGRGMPPLEQTDINLHTKNGQPIPKVGCIRILGLLIQAQGSNMKTIEKLTTKTENMIRLIIRVSNRHGGLTESNLLRLYHAFLMSHINYVAAALDWSKVEETKINTLMRKSIKRVLGIPITASTEKLELLGVHNTLDEVIEAQSTAQTQRLLTTRAGRQILRTLGYRAEDLQKHSVQLPPHIRETIHVEPIPRNVHPQHNEGRRAARARALLQHAAKNPTKTAFVDVAQHATPGLFTTVSVDFAGNVLSAATIKAPTAVIAEQVAIAQAMQDLSRPNVYTDSRSAARAFLLGRIATEAAKILTARSEEAFHNITWFPAHMGHAVHPELPNVNELANDRARGFTSRAGPNAIPSDRLGEYRDPLLTFHEIISHYQLSRRTLPLPHPKLTRPQSIAFRMLQTNTFPTRSRFSLILPSIEPHCLNCSEAYCNLKHMLWQCPALRTATDYTTEHEWTSALSSTDSHKQLMAVQRACERAEDQGLPPPARAWPATT